VNTTLRAKYIPVADAAAAFAAEPEGFEAPGGPGWAAFPQAAGELRGISG
jgi:hypothetical protein